MRNQKDLLSVVASGKHVRCVWVEKPICLLNGAPNDNIVIVEVIVSYRAVI